MTYDRGDIQPCWFMFFSCGKPFFYCLDRPDLWKMLTDMRREWRGRGVHVERLHGHAAAAAIDSLLNDWPEARMTVPDDGSFVFVSPHGSVIELGAEA